MWNFRAFPERSSHKEQPVVLAYAVNIITFYSSSKPSIRVSSSSF